MKQILEDKLAQFNSWLGDLDMPGYEYTLGQRDLCVELLSIYTDQTYDDDLYYDDADEFYYDPLEQHYSELAWYKQQEIDNMYDVCNHFTRGLGQSVINLDSYWFTSDEIEAFRVIWQRRLSA